MSEESIRQHFRGQSRSCARLKSPLYERFCQEMAQRLADVTAVESAVLGWRGDPHADALALRLLGALRYLVLAGDAPGLAHLYPPRGDGELGDEDWRAIRETFVRHEKAVLAMLVSPPQTNEVGRSAVLLGGFLTVAERFGTGLHLFEVGASGGLNVLWDRWCYRTDSWTWGDESAPLHLTPEWTGRPPPLVDVTVSSRAACDLQPVDLRRTDEQRRMLAYIWPDQDARLGRAGRAIEALAASDVHVEQAPAIDWLERSLSAREGPGARVVFHSIFLQYLPAGEQRALVDLLEHHGRQAGESAPLAWLRMESAADYSRAELKLTTWPGGEHRLLAYAHFHGDAVEWLAD